MKIIFLLLGLIFLVSCSNPSEPTTTIVDYGSVHLTLGIPRDADTTNDYIIIRHQYVISYNSKLNVPNWVAWELNDTWFGNVDRYSGNFITDTSLPSTFYKVKHSDYTNSGYDRGHMVMSESRTLSVDDNKSTFILTDILPQTPDLNRGVWLRFETYLNNLSHQGHEIFIYDGGVYSTKSINGKVAIPDSCFKIAVILNAGQGLADVNKDTQVIAVMIPNIDGILNDPWENYKTTVRKIEKSTGYDFLNNISKSIQDIIEIK